MAMIRLIYHELKAPQLLVESLNQIWVGVSDGTLLQGAAAAGPLPTRATSKRSSNDVLRLRDFDQLFEV